MQLATRFTAHLSARWLMHLRKRVMRRACDRNWDPRENLSDLFTGARARSAKFVIEFANSRINNRANVARARGPRIGSSRVAENWQWKLWRAAKSAPRAAPCRLRRDNSLDNSPINMLISGSNFSAWAFTPPRENKFLGARAWLGRGGRLFSRKIISPDRARIRIFPAFTVNLKSQLREGPDD